MAGIMAAGLAGCSGSTQATTAAAPGTEAQADTQAEESAGARQEALIRYLDRLRLRLQHRT